MIAEKNGCIMTDRLRCQARRECRAGFWYTSQMLVALMLIGGVLSPVHAQSARSSIVGTVTDSSGGVVSGARVTVVNTGTRATRTVETNARGDYSVSPLDVGTYEITAEMTGFKKVVTTQVQLEIDRVLRRDLLMEVGPVTDQVTTGSL
jgi:hypothetical protein